MGGENNKEELFGIDVGTGCCGGLNSVGAFFCTATYDDAKLACITECLDGVQGDVKEHVADKFGQALIYLNTLEAKLPDVLAEIVAQKANILENIAVAQ